jgi:hypothetical protein
MSIQLFSTPTDQRKEGLMRNSNTLILGTMLILFACALPATAQDSVVVLTGAELTRVVPPGFYFQGLSAPTQIRNSAVARFGEKRYVIAGLVDTAGYAADVRAKYEGFLITDSAIKINDSALPPGAYGFGFAADGKLNILDLGATEILSIAATKDAAMKRPRPLTMIKGEDGVRLYRGKDYVVITTN